MLGIQEERHVTDSLLHRPTYLKTSRRLGALSLLIMATSALSAPVQATTLFASSIALSSLNGTTGFRLDGTDASQFSGTSVSPAGDVNGDGYTDFLVGGPFDPTSLIRGRAYVVFGTATAHPATQNLSALNGSNGFRILGGFDSSGYSLAAAGDVNGDGLADLIFGAPDQSPAGAAYVVFGRQTAFPSSLAASSLNGTTGFRLTGATTGDLAGFSVAGGKDVNGDGISDIVVGAPGADSTVADSGAAFVVFGKTSAFASSISLSSLNGTTGFRLNGSIAAEGAGNAVAVSDINFDGKAEVVVGAPGPKTLSTITGGAYVVLGKGTAFVSAIELSALAGTDGFRLNGIGVGDGTGEAVANAGDVNGDGFGDIVIGAPGSDPGGLSNAGRAYVMMGKAAAFTSTVNLSALNGATGFRLNGAAAGDQTGWSVGSASDLDGDGYTEIVAGAPGAQTGGAAAGNSYVVFGKSAAYAPNVAASLLNGTNGFQLQGTVSTYSGFAVGGTGDINGDGFGDVAIGAPLSSASFSNAGSTYVLHGRVPVAAVTRVGGGAAQYISGGAFADSISGRGGNDILEGRGGADALNGATGSDTASYEHSTLGVVVNLTTPATNTNDAAGDTYNLVENLRGTTLADTITGTNIPNTLEGLAGDDTIRGNSGIDIINGGLGDDALTGGFSNDLFVYSLTTETTVANPDGITDFSAGSSTTFGDRIDLRLIDADTTTSGNQAFSFIGTSAFTLGTKGQLRVSLSGHAVVTGDVNGDQVADFAIDLLNVTTLANLDTTDFLP